MSKGWWIVARVITALVLVGLVIGGGFATYRLGWTQGYEAGQSGGDDGGETAEVRPYRLPLARPLLAFGLILLGLAAVGKILRLIFWRSLAVRWATAGGPWMHGLGRAHWPHHQHGPVPPWCWGTPPAHTGDESAAAPGSDEAA